MPYVKVLSFINRSHESANKNWRNIWSSAFFYSRSADLPSIFDLPEAIFSLGQNNLSQTLGTCNIQQEHFKDQLWKITKLFWTEMNKLFRMCFNLSFWMHSSKRSTSKVVFRQMHNKVVAVAWWTNHSVALLVNFGLSCFPATLSLLARLLVCLLFPCHSEVLLSPTFLKAIWWTGHSEYKEEEKRRKKNCMWTSSFHTQLI